MFVSQGGFNAQGEVNSSIANPASGYQGGVTGSALTPGHVQRQLVANGEVLARYGDAPTQEENTPQTNTPAYVDTADVRLQAAQIRPRHKSLDPVAYTVVGGETLKDIARNVLGDASLWWRIADANSLAVSGDGQLTAGQTLTVPKLSLNANSVETFQPYDPSQAMGSMDPVLPVPANGGGCGGIGAIIMVAVAVVVSIYTAGVLSGASVNIMQAGMSVLSGGTLGAGAAGIAGMSQLGVVGAAMAAGAVGSVASQAVGNLIGAQDGFNWKSVALSALGSGVSSALGVSGVLPKLGGTFAEAALRQAVSGTISQGIGSALGWQPHFDWKSVAAGAVGAGVGATVGQALQSAGMFGSLGNGFAADLARGTVSGFAGGLTTAVMKGGRVSVQQVATDAFGNALGNSLASSMSTSSLYTFGSGRSGNPGITLGAAGLGLSAGGWWAQPGNGNLDMENVRPAASEPVVHPGDPSSGVSDAYHKLITLADRVIAGGENIPEKRDALYRPNEDGVIKEDVRWLAKAEVSAILGNWQGFLNYNMRSPLNNPGEVTVAEIIRGNLSTDGLATGDEMVGGRALTVLAVAAMANVSKSYADSLALTLSPTQNTAFTTEYMLAKSFLNGLAKDVGGTFEEGGRTYNYFNNRNGDWADDRLLEGNMKIPSYRDFYSRRSQT